MGVREKACSKHLLPMLQFRQEGRVAFGWTGIRSVDGIVALSILHGRIAIISGTDITKPQGQSVSKKIQAASKGGHNDER